MFSLGGAKKNADSKKRDRADALQATETANAPPAAVPPLDMTSTTSAAAASPDAAAAAAASKTTRKTGDTGILASVSSTVSMGWGRITSRGRNKNKGRTRQSDAETQQAEVCWCPA